MSRPVIGAAVDPPLKRTYGGARRGSQHISLPYLGKPSRKLEGEGRESCDSEEEEELDGARKGTDVPSKPGCRPLAELQKPKTIEPVKPDALSTSKPPLPDYSHSQQENLSFPAPPASQRRHHPTPKPSHRGNAEQDTLLHKSATEGNVSLSNASALDGSRSCSALELERHLRPQPPHGPVLALSSRRQPGGLRKREPAVGPAPQLPHCGQGSGREEVGHLQCVPEKAFIPPDLHSQDWLALPDIDRKKWVLKVSHLGRGGFSEVHSTCLHIDSLRPLYQLSLLVVSLLHPCQHLCMAGLEGSERGGQGDVCP